MLKALNVDFRVLDLPYTGPRLHPEIFRKHIRANHQRINDVAAAHNVPVMIHSCISTAGPMACGTVGEAVENVREVFEIMKPGGGYFMAPTHMIQDNSPTENVVAAYRAALDFGRY